MDQYIRAQLLRSDFIGIDKSFTEHGLSDIHSIILLKQAFIVVSNFCEFENSVRSCYREYSELSDIYNSCSNEFGLARYLRNKFAGHIKQELISKAIEWRPEMRMFLDSMDDDKVMHTVNSFILETAINTYVNSNGKHKVFDSETDLMYPPDNKRFLIFFTKVIRTPIEYLSRYIEVMSPNMAEEIASSRNLEHFIKAGKTEFSFIKK